jgi:hypothetical protein
MLKAEDHVLDGEVERLDDTSPNTSGDHEESEQDEKKEKSEVDDAVWNKDAAAASTTMLTTSETPGLVSLQDTSDTSDTDSSASVPPSPTRSNSLVEVSTTPAPLAEGIFAAKNNNVDADAIQVWIEAAVAAAALTAASQQQELINAAVATALAAQPPLLAEGIINKVDGQLPSSEGKHMVSDEKPTLLVLSKADLSTETQALQDLDGDGSLPDGSMKSKDSEETTPSSASAIGDRSGSILNRQDDPFAPREGKTLVWTGVSMTLVCSRVCFFNAPLAAIPHNPSYSSIDTRYDRHRKAKGLSANC